MPQPPVYERQSDLSDFSAANPGDPHDGAALDAEFDRLKITLDAVLQNLALIQRDDGDLASQSVGLDQLSPDVDVGLRSVTTWATGTLYRVRDAVFESSVLYRCLRRHTSGTFATDLAAGNWVVLLNLPGVFEDLSEQAIEDAIAGAVSAAAIASGAAATAITNAQVAVSAALAAVNAASSADVDEQSAWAAATAALAAQVAAAGSVSSNTLDEFVGDGTDTTFTMSDVPPSEAYVWITIDGVYQQKSTYSVSGAVITFSEAPPDGALIETVLHVLNS